MSNIPASPQQVLYQEKLSSNKTEALFLALMLLFLWLFICRVQTARLDWLAGVFLTFFALFLFYVVNYRTLTIQITAQALNLTFGIFRWRVPRDNVADCQVDELPLLMKYGGAGIHFMFIRQRYRASFNFLEYPRVVVAFRKKVGPVRDISFSTRLLDTVLRLMLGLPAGNHIQERSQDGTYA